MTPQQMMQMMQMQGWMQMQQQMGMAGTPAAGQPPAQQPAPAAPPFVVTSIVLVTSSKDGELVRADGQRTSVPIKIEVNDAKEPTGTYSTARKSTALHSKAQHHTAHNRFNSLDLRLCVALTGLRIG